MYSFYLIQMPKKQSEEQKKADFEKWKASPECILIIRHSTHI